MATSYLGNLSNLFTALGLTTLARMSAAAVALTGGTMDGVTIGATTPAPGSYTSLGATLTCSFGGVTYIGTAPGANTAAVPTGSQGLAIQWNVSQGSGEVDYISLYSSGTANGHTFYSKTTTTAMVNLGGFYQSGLLAPYGATITGTLQGVYTLAAEQKIAVGLTAPMMESMSARMQFLATCGGTLAVSSTDYISWSTRIIVMNMGNNANTSTAGYFDITQPANGQAVAVYAGAAARSFTAAGLLLNAWEALYYIPPIGAANTTQPGNFAVVSYSTASITIPPHWILICQCNGDSSVYSWLGGECTMLAGQSVNRATVTTASPGGAAATAATAAQVQAGTDNAAFATSAALANSGTEQTLTYASSITWNMAIGYNAKVTLTGNVTFAAPSGAIPGRTYVLRIIQDGTGSRTAAWASAFDWGAAGTPTLTTTASKVDLVSLYCVSTTQFYASIVKGF